MTREEAIEVIEDGDWWDSYITESTIECINADDELHEALDLALAALRPVSREQVEQVWGGCEWCDEEWGTCDPITNRFTMPPRGGIRFCPMCGKPLTDEAVDILLRRLEAMQNETG